MIEVSCPKCGGVGQAPKEKINTGLTCKKCHARFHVSTSGRSILGEPPVIKNGKDARGHGHAHDPMAAPPKPASDWKESLPEFTVTGRSAIIALVAIVLGAGVYFMMSRPTEGLSDYAKQVAQAFADDDLGRLKGFTTSASADDLVQWYGTVRPKFEDLKKQWVSKEVLVGVLVIEEDLRKRSGEVTAIIAPTKASERDASLSGSRDMGIDPTKPMEITLKFTSDQWGKWRLDGTKMRDSAARAL